MLCALSLEHSFYQQVYAMSQTCMTITLKQSWFSLFLLLNTFCVINFRYYHQCFSSCVQLCKIISQFYAVISNNAFTSFNKYSIDHIPCSRLCSFTKDISQESHNSRKSCYTHPLLQGNSRHLDLAISPTLGKLRMNSRVTILLHLLLLVMEKLI